jgi:hypothetical protein
MEDFELKALQTFKCNVKFWARYVDDTFCIIQRDKLDVFTQHLNSLHDKIKFTIEKECDNSLPMLDVNVKRKSDGNLSFSVYRKPTHTDHYLQFTSHQPLEHKLGVIRTLQHRAKHHTSTADDLVQENHHIKKVLAISGYPAWTWDSPKTKKKQRSNKNLGHVTFHMYL